MKNRIHDFTAPGIAIGSSFREVLSQDELFAIIGYSKIPNQTSQSQCKPEKGPETLVVGSF